MNKRKHDSEWVWIAIPIVISIAYLGVAALLFWAIALALWAGYMWGWKEREKSD